MTYMGFLGRAAVLPVRWISGMERPGLFVPPPLLPLLHVGSSSFGRAPPAAQRNFELGGIVVRGEPIIPIK